jgi:S1-C subfamily serine protease
MSGLPVPCTIQGSATAAHTGAARSGVIFNMILAFAVLTAQVGSVGYGETTYDPGVRVPVVTPGSAADRYGIRPGDTILALDGEAVAPSARPRLAAPAPARVTRPGAAGWRAIR